MARSAEHSGGQIKLEAMARLSSRSTGYTLKNTCMAMVLGFRGWCSHRPDDSLDRCHSVVYGDAGTDHGVDQRQPLHSILGLSGYYHLHLGIPQELHRD